MIAKRLLLAAGGALAAVVMLIPSAAQAEDLRWYDDHVKLITEPKSVEPKFSLSFTAAGFTTSCGGELSGTIYNNETFGEGEISGGMVKSCETNAPECTVQEALLDNLPWAFVLTTGTALTIAGVAVEFTYAKQCEPLGIPPVVQISGSATGGFSNEAGAIEFENAGHLTANEEAAALNGYIQFGTTITAK